jgi:hypothetical protein
MIHCIIQILNDSLSKTSIPQKAENIANNSESPTSIWLWVAIAELAIIIFLLFKFLKKKSDLDFADISKDKMRGAKNSDIDMGNLMNSINGSKKLYKELSRTCHPDRFINSGKQLIAESIFQEISKNKRDFNKLTKLKQRALTELNINIK